MHRSRIDEGSKPREARCTFQVVRRAMKNIALYVCICRGYETIDHYGRIGINSASINIATAKQRQISATTMATHGRSIHTAWLG